MKLAAPIAVGDWIRVKALWPGIWKVSRILSGFYETQWSVDAVPVHSNRTILFLDRVVNDEWKRSFKTQSCEASYVAHLDREESRLLEAVFASDAGLRGSFAKYQAAPHPLHLIANLALGGMPEELVSEFPNICNELLAPGIEQGLTIPAVLRLLAQRDLTRYQRKNPQRVTLQLTCHDHEIRSGEFVYRTFRARPG